MSEECNKASIRGKIAIKGVLKLESPLRIGDGEQGTKEADVYVLKDRAGKPIIPGSSLAGVLRANFSHSPLLDELFGFVHYNKNETEVQQSALVVSDIILSNAEIAVRDGVGINHETGIAISGAKFNYEVVNPGAEGDICITITLRKKDLDNIDKIKNEADKIAELLCNGCEIGSLTSKGFGRIYCTKVKVHYYDFSRPEAVKAWLTNQPSDEEKVLTRQKNRWTENEFVVEGDFSINGSLLVRQTPDDEMGSVTVAARQMKGKNKNGNECWVIPGTSIKGVLRHKAKDILGILGIKDTEEKLNELMGSSAKGKRRFWVDEVYIDKDAVDEEMQGRNKIDRFTGGTMSGHLFADIPIWQISPWNKRDDGPWQRKPIKPVMKIRYGIKDCKPWEAGMALFLLKELCLGKIAVGGGKAIGRGTLSGTGAIIHYNDDCIKLGGNGQVQGDAAEEHLSKLKDYEKALLGDR